MNRARLIFNIKLWLILFDPKVNGLGKISPSSKLTPVSLPKIKPKSCNIGEARF